MSHTPALCGSMFQDVMFTSSTFTSQCFATSSPLDNDNLHWKSKQTSEEKLAGVSPLSVFSSPVIYFLRPENPHCGLRQAHLSRLLLGWPGVSRLETAVESIDKQQRPCRWFSVLGVTGQDPGTVKEAVKKTCRRVSVAESKEEP